MPGDPVGSSGDEVYLVPLSGRPAELYVTLPFRAFARDIDITPDGRMVVAAVEESQSDAWIVNNFDPELAGRSR